MGLWMVGCDFCDEWFHGRCVDVAEEDAELIESYCCPNCTKKNLGTSNWKRKCLLPSCKLPALFEKNKVSGNVIKRSKYCSPEHGVEWFKLNIEAHTHDTDDGLRNQAISPAELVAAIRGSGSLSRFKQLGEHIQLATPHSSQSATPADTRTPTPTPKNEDRDIYLPEERENLDSFESERMQIYSQLRYIENKATYIDYAKLRASAQKTICGFDRKLVWDDEEWQNWCDSQEGQRALQEIEKFKLRQEEKRVQLTAKLEEEEKAAASANTSDKKPKRGQRKRKQQVQVPLDLREIWQILGGDVDERENNDEDVCMLEKRRCSRHSNWQYIRAEEVELDERVARNSLAKIEAAEQAIARRATARRLKDSTKDGGRCISVN